MDNGFIKLYRQIQDWEWYTDSATVHFFIHCLFCANWKPKNWQGQEIKRGQFVSSYANLSAQTGLSVKQIRTRIDRLVNTGELEVETTNRFTIITVCKYNTYQSKYSEEGNQKANESQSKGNQRANKGQQLKKVKKLKKDKKVRDTVLSETEQDALEVCEHLLSSITDSDPDHRYNSNPPDLYSSNWLKEIDRAIRLDGRTVDDLRHLISILYYDNNSVGDFWRSNVESGKKLRQHFDKIRGQLQRLPKYKQNNHDEFIDKLFA